MNNIHTTDDHIESTQWRNRRFFGYARFGIFLGVSFAQRVRHSGGRGAWKRYFMLKLCERASKPHINRDTMFFFMSTLLRRWKTVRAKRTDVGEQINVELHDQIKNKLQNEIWHFHWRWSEIAFKYWTTNLDIVTQCLSLCFANVSLGNAPFHL